MSSSNNSFPEAQKISGTQKKIIFVVLSVFAIIIVVGFQLRKPKADVKKQDASVETPDRAYASPVSQEEFAPLSEQMENRSMDSASQGYEESANTEMIMAELQAMRSEMEMMKSQRQFGNQAAGPAVTPLDPMQERLSPEYQSVVSHFKKTIDANAWIEMNYDKMKPTASAASLLDPNLQELYEGASTMVSGDSYTFPTGTRIVCSTDDGINSDYAGYETGRVVAPSALRNYKVLLRISGQVNDRIPATVDKLISPDGLREYQLEGQVEMDYPGLKGKVKNNWPKRVVPTVIASTIGIGYSVVASQLGGKSSEDRIDTRDEFVQGTAAQSVGLTQDEVLRYRQDLPNTIKVGPRTTFRVLLLKPLKVQL